MSDYKGIHETVIKDIMDLIDDLKDINFDAEKGLFSKAGKGMPMRASSIAKASSNLTLVFPIICSRGISIENAAMISKAIEKRCVSMLQMLFSSYQFTNDKNVTTVQDYIDQFHKNISTRGATLDDLFDMANRLEGFGEFSMPKAEVERIIREDMKRLNAYLPSNINESSINRFVVKEDSVEEIHQKQKDAKRMSDILDDMEDVADLAKKHVTYDELKGRVDSRKGSTEYFKNQVLDTDYKKANELMPTTMYINFSTKDDDGNVVKIEDGVVGVKAKLYPISSDEVVSHIADKTQSRNWVTNFIKATTREISFVKDFALAIDKAKIDAMSMSVRKSGSSKMWKVLERRATVSRLKRSLARGNDASAITTLCISQEEVEYMKKHYSIDMEQVKNVIGLFESLNLMCVCIVDETLEVAKFIFDENDPMWETISFTHLERESNDNTYKRVVNLMTKISR
ncbi:MAG: hypothetical protein IKL53_02960 [Lachnospiraceae bacterium]|nr:hypothetical protein [Lachnospiraceae bacterium]